MPCSERYASGAAIALMGCYRRGDYPEPEIFMDGLRTLFRAYPESVVKHVTNPLTGVPGTISYPPTLAEIRRDCENKMRPLVEHEARLNRERERQQQEALPKPPGPTPEQRRATVAAFKARFNATPEATQASLDAAEADAKQAQRPPIVLSEAALRAIGLKPKPDAAALHPTPQARRSADPTPQRRRRAGRGPPASKKVCLQAPKPASRLRCGRAGQSAIRQLPKSRSRSRVSAPFPRRGRR